jgi:uncharacterized protein (DUF58 family)
MSIWIALSLLMAAVGALADAPGLLLVATVTLAYGSLTRLWTHYGARRVSYERRLSTRRAVAGDSIGLDIAIWNRKPLPLPWVGADDLVSEDLPVRERPVMDQDMERIGRRILHNAWALAWYERVVRHFHLDGLKRGVYDFGPVRVRVRDILGREAVDTEQDTAETLVVAPRTVPVRTPGVAWSPIGEKRARSSLFVDPSLYGGVRPFQPGDSLRRVHWRATARLGTVVSRRYEPARGRSVILAVDVQTVDGPTGQIYWDEPLFEALCVVAASMARRLLDEGAAVGVAAPSFTGTTQRMAWLPPQASESQLGRVGGLLARIGPVSSAAFGDLLTWTARRVPPGATLTVISARQPAGYLPALRRLAQSGYAVEMLLLGKDAAAVAAMTRRAGIPSRTAHLVRDGRDAEWEEADALVVGG